LLHSAKLILRPDHCGRTINLVLKQLALLIFVQESLSVVISLFNNLIV